MRLAVTAQRRLLFGVAAAFVVAADAAVVASRKFAIHPGPLSAAVLADVLLVVPLLWYALVVRSGAARPRSLLPVALACLAVAGRLLPNLAGDLRALRFLAAPAELALVVLIVRKVRALEGDPAERLREGLSGMPAGGIVATELSVLWYALFSWRARPVPGTFSVHRRSGWAAVCGALLLVTVAESAGVHFLLLRWSHTAAWIATALAIYGALWLVGDLRALQLRGVRIEGGALRVRIGLRWEADVPLALLRGEAEPAQAVRMTALGSPNLALRFSQPVEVRGLFGRRRSGEVLGLLVDDPQALRAALGLS
jgi:hypothetical protein